ncbi:carboxylesterase/lipase family protein [Rhodococcus koreensis]
MTIVDSPCGSVRGSHRDGVHSFRGIPYGAPPIGRQRFRTANPRDSWSGLLDATAFGASCPQDPRPGTAGARSATANGQWACAMGWPVVETNQDEDCLVLNVWTPQPDDGCRPVMVHIHGGGFRAWSASHPIFDGAELARHGDVVVVTMNHRLGALGYLYLGDLLGSSYAAGNPGLTDLILALQWVKENIAAFGGNPDNVTIFGESGGGKKVSHLLAMPAAQGLFHRAIIQSGALSTAITREAAAEYTERFVDRLGIECSEDSLSTIPVGKLIEVEASLRRDGLEEAGSYGGFGGPQPLIDGVTVLDHPAAAIRSGASARVPLIVGSTLDETALPPNRERMMALDRATLAKHFRKLEPHSDDIINHFAHLWPDLQPGELAVRIETAVSFRFPSTEFAISKSASGDAPVFVYVVSWQSGACSGWVKAAHTIDVPLTMRTLDAAGGWILDATDSGLMSDRMSRAWVAFARTGRPDDPINPPWSPFTPERHETMIFDSAPIMTEDPFRERKFLQVGTSITALNVGRRA